MYADDDQLYGSCRPEDVDKLTTLLLAYVAKISDWMRSNRLQFNAAKAEVMCIAETQRTTSDFRTADWSEQCYVRVGP